MTTENNEKSFLLRAKQFIKFRIIHVDDSPHRIALGVSLGLFTAFLPFLGIHTITAFALAFITRSNKVVAVLCSWLSNPLTVIPIFVPCYALGRAVVSIFRDSPPANIDQTSEILKQSFSFSGMVNALTSSNFWKELATLFGKIGLELTTGCLICGTTAAITSYFIIYKMIVAHRKKIAKPHKQTTTESN